MPNHHIALFQISDVVKIGHLQPADWGDIKPNMLAYCLQSFCTPIKVLDQDEIVGIGSLIVHENSAWLAHIIVAEHARGRGIGQHIVEYLLQLAKDRGIPSVNLIATKLGEAIYTKCGFRSVGNLHSYKKKANYISKALSQQLVPATENHMEQIAALDEKSTGEKRLNHLKNQLSKAIVFESNQQVEGYYLPELKEGPIYASTEVAGLALMELKCSMCDLVILPEDNNAGIQFLTDRGFVRQENTPIRMVYGEDTHWIPQNIYSRIGGNYG